MSNFVRKVGRFVFGKMMPIAAYPVMKGPLKGTKFILGALAGEGGGASVYFNRLETEQTERMIREVFNGDIFFDVGANAGYYSMLGSRLVGESGRVVAFEPLIRNLSYLHRHKNVNNASNVMILGFACSDENSIVSFSLGDNIAMGSISKQGGGEFPVATITLDEAAERIGLIPNVMKIDVEGAELDVLAGAQNIIKDASPKIFLSTHSAKLREDCLKHLEQAGYSIEPLIDSEDPHEFFAERR